MLATRGFKALLRGVPEGGIVHGTDDFLEQSSAFALGFFLFEYVVLFYAFFFVFFGFFCFSCFPCLLAFFLSFFLLDLFNGMRGMDGQDEQMYFRSTILRCANGWADGWYNFLLTTVCARALSLSLSLSLSL